MRSRLNRNANPGCFSHRGDSNQNGQEVHSCQEGNDPNGNKDDDSPSGANEEKEKDEVANVVLGSCMPMAECLPQALKMKCR